MRKCAYSSHLKLLGFKSMKAMEALRLGRRFHGCGRISVCDVWPLGLTKLSEPSCKPVRLQTLKRRLLLAPSRVLTWLFS